MWPTEARTSNPLPRYFSIVFAFAGDSTMTSDLVVAMFRLNSSFLFRVNIMDLRLMIGLGRMNSVANWEYLTEARCSPSRIRRENFYPQVLHTTMEHRAIATAEA
jgi:hypothetical protein